MMSEIQRRWERKKKLRYNHKGHYERVIANTLEKLEMLRGIVAEQSTLATIPVVTLKQDRAIKRAFKRVRAVAKGGTINGVYAREPQLALDAFRADLLLVVGE